MQPSQFLNADYLDIVFDNRNKNYGGYELRKHYTARAYKALGGTFILIGITLTVILFGINRSAAIVAPRLVATNIADIHPPINTPPVKVVPPPPAAPKLKTPDATTLRITHDRDVPPATTLPAVAIPATGTGTAPGSNALSVPGGTGSVTTAAPVTPHTNTPFKFVEQMPEYKDLPAYLAKAIHYPDMARAANIQGRVIISFVVNEDGSISDAKILRGIGGGCDEEALRVVNAMPHWKPGKQNGQAVKVLFTLPITFVLQ